MTPAEGSNATAVETVVLAVIVFATTNVDDLVLLAAFFADARARPRAIVLGQLVGMGILVGASAAATFGTMALPAPWVALTGAVPLVMGLRKLLKLRSRPAVDDAVPTSTMRDSSQVFAVAVVTIANGGDNLGVYIPLFASHPSSSGAARRGLWSVAQPSARVSGGSGASSCRWCSSQSGCTCCAARSRFSNSPLRTSRTAVIR